MTKYIGVLLLPSKSVDEITSVMCKLSNYEKHHYYSIILNSQEFFQVPMHLIVAANLILNGLLSVHGYDTAQN